MSVLTIDKGEVVLHDPCSRDLSASVGGTSEASYSIEVKGMGQLVGLSYSVPAHTTGNIKATLQTSALTSQDVEDLNKLAMGLLDASYHEVIKEHEKTSASASLSLWGWFLGGNGASASYEKTRDTMKSKGLSDAQITQLMTAFMEKATNMSTVQIDFYVNNELNDYPVEGDLYLYTVSGTIQTEKGTATYRMLAEQGSAGGPPPSGGGAPSSGVVAKYN